MIGKGSQQAVALHGHSARACTQIKNIVHIGIETVLAKMPNSDLKDEDNSNQSLQLSDENMLSSESVSEEQKNPVQMIAHEILMPKASPSGSDQPVIQNILEAIVTQVEKSHENHTLTTTTSCLSSPSLSTYSSEGGTVVIDGEIESQRKHAETVHEIEMTPFGVNSIVAPRMSSPTAVAIKDTHTKQTIIVNDSEILATTSTCEVPNVCSNLPSEQSSPLSDSSQPNASTTECENKSVPVGSPSQFPSSKDIPKPTKMCDQVLLGTQVELEMTTSSAASIGPQHSNNSTDLDQIAMTLDRQEEKCFTNFDAFVANSSGGSSKNEWEPTGANKEGGPVTGPSDSSDGPKSSSLAKPVVIPSADAKPTRSLLKRRAPDSCNTSSDSSYLEEGSPPKRRKEIRFNNVTVYYFPRTQGFTCVPSQVRKAT